MTTKPKFKCSYILDDRVDRDLANFNQEVYRSLQTVVGSKYKVRYEEDGTPDPVEYFLLYTSALIYGAADGVLTLVLHNLGREARILERQVFEYWVRAAYFAEHPDIAKQALLSTPFQERKMLDELGYKRSAERYQRVLKLCDEVKRKTPGAETYREPSLRALIDPNKDPELNRFYGLHYRVNSQLAHATWAGVGGVWNEKGLTFDSRQSNPNYSLANTTIYLLAFLNLLSEHLSVDISTLLAELRKRWDTIQAKLEW